MRTRVLIIFGLFIFCNVYLRAQNITTIAGNGSSTFSGESVPASSSYTPNPAGGVFDKNGNYYFADGTNSNRIRKITPSGIITTVAGNGMGGFAGDGGPATNARLNAPCGVALDTSGNIYVADAQNMRVRRVDIATGIITTIAGTGIGGYSGDGFPATDAMLWAPQDVCIDKNNNLFIGDAQNARVRKVNPSGIIITYAGNGLQGHTGDGGLATSAEVAWPTGLALDDTGNLFIACNSSFSNRVRKVSVSGVISSVVGNGNSTYAGDGMPATDAQLAPNKIAIDSFNNVYISDRFNNRVYKVELSSSTFHCVAGTGVVGDSGDGALATLATLNYPVGISLDLCNNLFITTVGSVSVPGSGRRIRKITFNPSPIATISIAVAPNDTVCAGTPVTYTATTTGASTAGYQWYKNGVLVPGATNATYTYAATAAEGGDSVRCVYTGVDLCSFSGHPVSNTLHVVATPLTVPVLSLSSVPAGAATAGSVVTVNATVASAGSSYSIQWYRNSVLFATTTVPYALYTKAAGTDVITARIASTDETGCYDTTTAAGLSIAQAMVGVAPVLPVLEASLHPNPARHLLQVTATAAIAQLAITNAAGRVYMAPQTATGSNSRSIDVAGLPDGVYLLQVTDAEGRYVMRRFVKE